MKANRIRISNLTELTGDEECKILNIYLSGDLVGHIAPGESHEMNVPIGYTISARESSVTTDLNRIDLMDYGSVYNCKIHGAHRRKVCPECAKVEEPK